MGLKDKLLTDESNYSLLNGTNGTTNPLAEASSTLHSDGTEAKSYSLNGSNQSVVNTGYQQYDTGTPNLLPSPSTYDLDGMIPSSPLSAPGYTNDSFLNGTYKNSAPPEGSSHI